MVYLTKEQIFKRKRLARFRFKTLARKAFLNKSWLSEIDDQIGEDVKKNVAIILNRSVHKQGLSLLEKSITKIPPNQRTGEELKKLEKVCENIPCFQVFIPVSIQVLLHALALQYFI